jgi:hypothetical protein
MNGFSSMEVQITDSNIAGWSVWTINWHFEAVRLCLPNLLKGAYTKSDDGKFIFMDGEYVTADKCMMALTAMLRVMVLHGGLPESLTTCSTPSNKMVSCIVRLDAAACCSREWSAKCTHGATVELILDNELEVRARSIIK